MAVHKVTTRTGHEVKGFFTSYYANNCYIYVYTFTLAIQTGEIVNTTVVEVMETRATIVCILSCFSKDIKCVPQFVWLLRRGRKIITLNNPTFHISNITGDPHSYNYPSQNITVTKLTSGKSYSLCVRAYNLTATKLQGDLLCEDFTTLYHHDEGMYNSYGTITV